MSASPNSQPDRALALLRRSGLARLSEFRRAGITAATICRLEAAGTITRLARGLYQLADADVDANHTLAEASKLVPKGVICLTSALAYHGLTDQIPARVWLAIGPKDWRPRLTYPPMRFAHYSPEQLESGIQRHAFTPAFFRDARKSQQWTAFVRDLSADPPSFETVVSEVAAFMGPLQAKHNRTLDRQYLTKNRSGHVLRNSLR